MYGGMFLPLGCRVVSLPHASGHRWLPHDAGKELFSPPVATGVRGFSLFFRST